MKSIQNTGLEKADLAAVMGGECPQILWHRADHFRLKIHIQ